MWGQLVIDSLVRPRAAARRLLALTIPADVLVQVALVAACLGLILVYAAVRLSGGAVDMVSSAMLERPLLGAAAQVAVMAGIAGLTFRVGRLLGGTGGFRAAVVLVVWLNVMMVLLQTVQLVALVLLPPLAAVLAIATVFWALWAFASFITEMHGFQNPMFVLGGMVLTLVVLFFVIAMLLALLGIAPQESR